MSLLTLPSLPSPRASVVIPVADARWLTDALTSLAAQTRPPDEVVLVLDGPVATGDVEEAARRASLDVHVHRLAGRTRAGPAAARNAGIAASTGDVILFQDADDVSLPHRLAWSLAALRGGRHGLACGAVRVMDAELRQVRAEELREPFDFEWHRRTNRVGTSGAAVRREVLEDVGGFAEDLLMAEDYDLWLRIAERYEVAHASDPLFLYRDWTESHSKQRSALADECLRAVHLRAEARRAAGLALR